MIGPTVPSLKNLCIQTIIPRYKEELEYIDETCEYTKYFYNDKELAPGSLPEDLKSDIKVASYNNKCFVAFRDVDLKSLNPNGNLIPFDLSQTISSVKEVAAACLREKNRIGTNSQVYIGLSIYDGHEEHLEEDQELGTRYKPGDHLTFTVNAWMGSPKKGSQRTY